MFTFVPISSTSSCPWIQYRITHPLLSSNFLRLIGPLPFQTPLLFQRMQHQGYLAHLPFSWMAIIRFQSVWNNPWMLSSLHLESRTNEVKVRPNWVIFNRSRRQGYISNHFWTIWLLDLLQVFHSFSLLRLH